MLPRRNNRSWAFIHWFIDTFIHSFSWCLLSTKRARHHSGCLEYLREKKTNPLPSCSLLLTFVGILVDLEGRKGREKKLQRKKPQHTWKQRAREQPGVFQKAAAGSSTRWTAARSLERWAGQGGSGCCRVHPSSDLRWQILVEMKQKSDAMQLKFAFEEHSSSYKNYEFMGSVLTRE